MRRGDRREVVMIHIAQVRPGMRAPAQSSENRHSNQACQLGGSLRSHAKCFPDRVGHRQTRRPECRGWPPRGHPIRLGHRQAD